MFSIKMSVCVCSPLVCYCCHASQHLGSTVTLAWDFLVSLCVCWAIYSESGTEPDVYLIHLYRSVLQLLHMPGFPSFSAPTESSCHKTFSPRMTREGGGQEGLHCARTGDGHVRGEARGGSDNLESLLIYSAVISLLSLHCQFVFPFVGAILQHGNDGSVQALSKSMSGMKKHDISCIVSESVNGEIVG